MTPPQDLDRLSATARAADHRDGLVELMVALLILFLAGSWEVAPSMAGLISLPFIFFGWKAISWAKERITYPRIGYSGVREDPEQVRPAKFLLFFAILGLGVVVVIWAIGGLGESAEWQRATALFSGVAFGAGLWALGDRSGLLRHRLLAASSVALGTWAWWTGEGLGYDVMVRFLLPLGGVVLLSGLGALIVFVATHPRVEG